MIAGAGTAAVTTAGELCLLPGGHQGSLAVNKVCRVTDLDYGGSKAVFRIRIRMFLGLPDEHPEPLVTSTDPDPAPDPSLFS
jgi:hypothetical protein